MSISTFSIRRGAFLWALALIVFGGLFAQPQSANAQIGGCPLPQNFQAGMTGYVLPGDANAVRDRPGTTAPSRVIGSLPGGAFFTIVGNSPVCIDGFNWWQISTSTLTGWTADGEVGRAWITPFTCFNSPPARLRSGMNGQVLPGDPNSIRAQPGAGNRLGTIPAGGVFSVTGNPQCDSSGRVWYPVNYSGVAGWTGEGEGAVYWIAPYGDIINPPPVPTPTQAPVPPTGCFLTPRLAVGVTGMVVPGLPNALRNQPGLNASGSTVIGNLSQGAIFTVLNGPVCRDGYNWWQVTASGLTGWTAEGEAGVYWIDPLVCANGMVSRIAPGMRTRVTPGLPNRVRTFPSTSYGAVIATIPAGGTALVLNNFYCDEVGRMWWQVVYGARIGWTAEGDSGVYWLSPA